MKTRHQNQRRQREEYLTLGPYQVRVVYKNNRHLYLRWNQDRSHLVLTCPWHTTGQQIRQVIEKSEPWIQAQLQKPAPQLRQQVPSKPSYQPGDYAVVWGRKVPVMAGPLGSNKNSTETRNSKPTRGKAQIQWNQDKTALYLPTSTQLHTAADKEKRAELWYRFYGREVLTALEQLRPTVEHLYGTWFTKVTIRWNKTRWGSCNSRLRTLNLNAALGMYPPPALRYVLLHEATHLFHPNHSPAFWAMLAEKEPHHAALRATLERPPGCEAKQVYNQS